ncbi:gamma-glutamylcyclotransferase family protein [Ralstonia solanacearum]|uniref:Gamma-glutamylcyclotransferase n=2 Tax=Ralstonia solanacearum TaxID=305 RepID=A0AAW5ZNK9_RALSL|nr:gamma-glutamylcyclotransferase [Ralstonia solanacearum]AST31926.2 gamma-glutamylcyclotransferase [Ralstonia solanacearum]MDB0508792.1 gamma-glutamylcyclotransferase [Ralstonia solanacearum]MDB0514056.1 gamma-glutamylcyclotransferase [Ralstonia solanacearum]MDB0526329.1 gamma-glutamylcyclotransferase [Ralstonia solanacearum]MDB0539814.1 gamma-glutamylcyclotransferase [Ralstonia solanacearum]
MTEVDHVFVFVYGTLRAGEANDLCLAAARRGIAEPKLVGHAMLHGRLYDFGAYPGLVPDPTGTAVRGDVYRIDPGLVPVLDEIEEVYPGGDALFLRETHTVMLGSEPLDCIVYPVDAAQAAGRHVITGGDWVAYRQAREQSVRARGAPGPG